MRVLITPEWYPWDDRPTFGVFCREQARAVATRHDVVVLSCRPDPELRTPFRWDERVEEGVRTVRLRFCTAPVPKIGGVSKLAGCLALLAKLRRAGWTPDLIHAHEYQAGRSALMLSRFMRVPVVVSEHYSGFALDTLSDRERERARGVFERAATVCPVGRDLERRLRRLAPAARFETVPNPVDTEIFRPSDASIGSPGNGRPLRLVAVGALVEVKGHRYLLEALAQLSRDRNVELHHVGRGPLVDQLLELTRSLGLEGKVSFHGPMSHRGVAAALREADLFVLPSLWETCGSALLEAMACGLPAVATRVGDVPALLGENGGVIVTPRSSEELAAGIAEVASRLDRYDRAAIAARTKATNGFEATSRKWSHAYSTACAARQGS